VPATRLPQALTRVVDVNDAHVPIRHPEALEAEVDGQRVLMSPKDYGYFGLVGTGAIVWDRIDGDVSVGRMITDLVTVYEADEAQIRADVAEFMSALEAAGLLAEND